MDSPPLSVATCSREFNRGRRLEDAVENRGVYRVFISRVIKVVSTLYQHYRALELPKRFKLRQLSDPTPGGMRDRAR